ncbi:hypothetical protein PR048_002311 [Dryococelus australis]|uniref:Uncharacterized protein n=1 Tax=Dryococelus australis TaxID=614101 RepID=A0ABQ9ILB8_9NEOP|nr:hypothetical protein PR048_002311 [Dryococelus australis]
MAADTTPKILSARLTLVVGRKLACHAVAQRPAKYFVELYHYFVVQMNTVALMENFYARDDGKMYEYGMRFLISGTPVAAFLACSSLATANRVRFPVGQLPDFRKWDKCRTMPPVGEFSRGSPVSTALASFRCCSILTEFHLHRLSSPSPGDPPTNGIVRHDSHLRKSSDPAGFWARFAMDDTVEEDFGGPTSNQGQRGVWHLESRISEERTTSCESGRVPVRRPLQLFRPTEDGLVELSCALFQAVKSISDTSTVNSIIGRHMAGNVQAGLDPLRLQGKEFMQGDMHRGLGSHDQYFGAMTNSPSRWQLQMCALSVDQSGNCLVLSGRGRSLATFPPFSARSLVSDHGRNARLPEVIALYFKRHTNSSIGEVGSASIVIVACPYVQALSAKWASFVRSPS